MHSHTCFQHRSYEPQVFRLSGSAPTPVGTAPLLNKGRDAISPRLPQCHHPYILPSRWFLPSPVSPVVGCATPPFSHTKMNYPPINHQNQAISKPDSVRDGTMGTNDISLLQFHGTNQRQCFSLSFHPLCILVTVLTTNPINSPFHMQNISTTSTLPLHLTK